MTDKTRVSLGNQRQILDQAGERLRDKDIDGYWALLARHDGYAGLAREAAANRGDLGRTANARLERFAQEQRGKPLDEAEREAIRNEVAAADLAQRERNLEDRGDHRISGQDSVDYHAAVFEAHDIPKEAYYPTVLQPAVDGNWGLRAGVLLPDAARPEWAKLETFPWSEHSEWLAKDLRPIIDAPFREQVIETAKTLPTQGLMEIEGFHGNDAAPASQIEQKAARPATASFATQFAALPPSPQRWLDVTLQKKPGELSEADLHALQAHEAYLQPQHPRRDETFRLVSDTYSFLYGDAPQPTDATGRPQRNGPLRLPPGTSRVTEAERRRSDELAGFGRELDRWKTGLGNDDMAQQRITGWLQRGLNELLWPGQRAPDAAEAGRRRYRGGPLLVDGLFGPVTADALDQAQADSGIALLQDRIGRIADDEGWQLLPA
ncbi:MAG: hypothetical protein ACK4Z4_01030 [Ferrovibrio sp.]